MKAYNIKWDLSDFKEDEDVSLPEEIEIPPEITDIEEVSDYISDMTGFCHNGFRLTSDK